MALFGLNELWPLCFVDYLLEGMTDYQLWLFGLGYLADMPDMNEVGLTFQGKQLTVLVDKIQ